MALALTSGDKLAAKQDAGTDCIYEANGDLRTIATLVDSYCSLAQGALSSSAVAILAPASGNDWIIDNFTIYNSGASTRVVTIYKTKNSTTYDATTAIMAVTLLTGERLIYSSSGWDVYTSLGIRKTSTGLKIDTSFFAPAQAIGATELYITNSGIAAPGGVMTAGMIFKWSIYMTKTGVATAVPVWKVYVGTNGSTSDTVRFQTATTVWTTAAPAQTAVADSGLMEIVVECIGAGGSGTLFGKYELRHQLTTTGFAAQSNQEQHGTTGAIDLSAANLILGVSVTAGASSVWTITNVRTETIAP